MVAAILQDPDDTSMVTSPELALTEHALGVVVAKTTAPDPFPPE